jgi:hypothetical protein
MTPSLSTNKPRINGDDAKKLNDYLVAVIGPHSGDEILDCTRQEYELNMEEQRGLHCFKKKARTFDLLCRISSYNPRISFTFVYSYNMYSYYNSNYLYYSYT